MSSIRVRATNKLLTKLGATKPSKNVPYEQAFNGFDQLQSGIISLDSALKGFIASLRGFHAASNVLLRAVEDVSNFKCTDIPSESPEVKQFIEVFKACSINIDIGQLTELAKKFETRVQSPAQGWVHQVNTLQKECQDFDEVHITYDHYTKKVVALREAHNKRAGAGKHEKSKEVDKLMRNEQKLVSVTNEYTQASDNTTQHLQDFLRHRDSTLLPLVQRLIEFRLDYSTAVHEATKKMEPLLKIDGYDEHLAVLEAYTTNGHAPSEKTPPRHESHIAASDIQVNKLSFSDFVGSPTDETTAAATTSAPPSSDSWGDFTMEATPPPMASSIPVSMASFEPFSATPPSPIAQSRTASGPRTNSGKIVNVLDFAESPPPQPAASDFMDFSLSDLKGSGQIYATAPPSSDFNPFAPQPPVPATVHAAMNASQHMSARPATSFDAF
ncbi:unnamed protein product [Aphanomyces euteiches]|uniref:Uncharacterized protein n=1 Tax=Aphanomyces euteiches TaxID=100861 RepID=A0A6G0X3X6_9STRA|nr:hypothetical protein Ae201684_008833 [Aphanomyces euteiches]KAH9134160.1 hypothetical protein AeRB84_019987 [Aphanomyces euteiches]